MILTFDIILALISTFCAALMIRLHFKNKRMLGELLIECKNGIQYVNRFSFILLIFMAAITVMIIPTLDLKNLDYRNFLMLCAVVTFIVLIGIQVLSKKGLYEHGVITSSAIILYKNVVFYDVLEQRSKKTIKVTFNGRSNTFFGGSYVQLDSNKISEVKALLKKSCKFKRR